MSLLGACSRKKQWRQLLLLRALSGQSTEAFHRERVWLKRQVSPVKICLIRVSLFRLTVENEVFNHPLQVFFVFFPNRSLLVMLLEEIIELSTSHLLKTNEKHEQICNVWKVSSILILTNYLWFFSDINNHLLHFQRFLQKYFNWASVKMPYFFFRSASKRDDSKHTCFCVLPSYSHTVSTASFSKTNCPLQSLLSDWNVTTANSEAMCAIYN